MKARSYVPFLLIWSLCLQAQALAQQPSADLNPEPLRPADTSSPRDTLRAFLSNVDLTAEAWRREEIPGDVEVADRDVSRWTIPDTRISIARVADGPRAGEFLFSAEVVADIDRLYRQARHLPYVPEAEVQEWRDKGELPFPEFTEEERQRLQGTLDYPPAGSPGSGADTR